jgi:hypothetical protein
MDRDPAFEVKAEELADLIANGSATARVRGQARLVAEASLEMERVAAARRDLIYRALHALELPPALDMIKELSKLVKAGNDCITVGSIARLDIARVKAGRATEAQIRRFKSAPRRIAVSTVRAQAVLLGADSRWKKATLRGTTQELAKLERYLRRVGSRRKKALLALADALAEEDGTITNIMPIG